MNILITGASAPLSRHLASALGGRHTITLTDIADVPGVVRCDLDHDDATNDLVRGAGVIVHSGGSDGSADVSERLDRAMRRCYNLVQVAYEEGVPRVVFLSSLSVMGRYDKGLAVTEGWKPAPTTDANVLGFHLGEFICREFAREHRIEVVCLRLGDLAWSDGAPLSTSALYPDDAVRAIESALTVDISEGYAGSRSYWGLFHVQSAVPNQRFLTAAAESEIGYTRPATVQGESR